MQRSCVTHPPIQEPQGPVNRRVEVRLEKAYKAPMMVRRGNFSAGLRITAYHSSVGGWLKIWFLEP